MSNQRETGDHRHRREKAAIGQDRMSAKSAIDQLDASHVAAMVLSASALMASVFAVALNVSAHQPLAELGSHLLVA